ncbi:SH3 domain-containing protein [Undibacterium sp. Jales W-56]|uniref:SH3 domain-containing protein n=1 Tax=Undibacterium sp. Jales W-56 TaxID=2897325 RepID=UPI0021D1DA59|nr:SH3 domain-containing protein [Undibacterium sp. Jales W-56]MCU6434983.1 SH3 domain-containing protein [Undibacterium sp. Jales W-56]
MRRSLVLSVVLGIASWSGLAQALDFKSIGASAVILYDAPSAKGGKVYVAPRGMPVEVILTYGTWSKVRDMGGDLSWVESKELVARRNVVVRVANAKIRAAADESSALVFSADKNVLLEMAEPVNAGWIKVKHRDGQIGYVKVTEVWGV